MCAMPDSSMAPAVCESRQAEFSHGLLDFCTASNDRSGSIPAVRPADGWGAKRKTRGA